MQRTLTLAAASPAGLRSEARFEGGAGAVCVHVCQLGDFLAGESVSVLEGVAASAGAELNHPILSCFENVRSVGAKGDEESDID